MKMLIFTGLLLGIIKCLTADPACKDRTPLGLRDGFIKSSQLEVLSSWNTDYRKSSGRLDSFVSWCSQSKVNKSEKYFQINLYNLTIINGIALQGDPNYRDNFIKKFIIDYKSALTDDNWKKFQNGTVIQSFTGNTDSDGTVYVWFSEPLVAKHIRLYAVEMKRSIDDTTVCLRMELYGCLNQERLYPLGMETKIIKDSQISKSDDMNNKENGRLHLVKNGACGNYANQYLTIDLIKPILIQAVAIQGTGKIHSSNAFVKSYNVKYGNSLPNLRSISKIFDGNNVTGIGPVLSFMPYPIVGSYVRVRSNEHNDAVSYYYMKLEIYGKRAECGNVLRDFNSSPVSSENQSHTPHDAYIDSPVTWCSNKRSNVYAHIIFDEPVAVGGISLQGDSNSDRWVKKFDIAIKDAEYKNTDIKNLQGATSRIEPIAVHWFSQIYLTKEIYIKPTDWSKEACMRFNIHGCKQNSECTYTFTDRFLIIRVLSEPTFVHLQQDGNKVTITWNKPDIALFDINKYELNLTAWKDYNSSFTFQTSKPLEDIWRIDIELSFGAATVNVTINAYIQTFFKSKHMLFKIKPIAPPKPRLEFKDIVNQKSVMKDLKIFAVSDTHGPISGYQVIVSSIIIDGTLMQNLSLFNQADSQERKLPYFLAKYVLTSEFHHEYYVLPPIVEGENEIKGFDIKLSTIGIYHFYFRAVILGQDIESHGYDNKTYYGEYEHHALYRRSLPKLQKVDTSKPETGDIELMEATSSTLYYQVIVMQINKTTLVLRPPRQYTNENLTTYENAGINEPYITAVLNYTEFFNLKEFTVGDGKFYGYNTSTSHQSRVRRDVNNKMYENGKLKPGLPYIYFQRAIDKQEKGTSQNVDVNNQGNEYSSPWSDEFHVSKKKKIDESSSPSSSISVTMVSGVAVGIVVFLILLALIIFFLWKRRAGKSSTDTALVEDHQMAEINRNTTNDEIHMENPYTEVNRNPVNKIADSSDNSGGNYYNISVKPKFSPIPVKEYPDYYLQNKEQKNAKLRKQFDSVPLNQIHSCDIALKHQDKNRYKNIIAYDHSRVILTPLKKADKNDYINANHIPDYSGHNKYIATQAPKDHTIHDFWQMILNQKPSSIIMVTNFEEKNKIKCAKYWSDVKAMSSNGITIAVLEKEHFADYDIRKIEVSFGEIKHIVMHFHFTSWPDHGCPEYPTLLLNFCYRYRHLISFDNPSPIIVHCSAGVGRSGTWIIIDVMLDLLRRSGVVDIFNYFESIRQSRYQMVQTFDQYVFIHSALYEVIACGDTGIKAVSFPTTFKTLITKKGTDEKFLLDSEFNRLNDITPDLSEEYFTKAMLLENMAKNRNTDILPRDSRLITTSSYLNAVQVDGYKIQNGFIVTEAPSHDTITHFWSAVMECHVTTVVVLYDVNECVSNLPVFWPVDSDLKYNGVTVKLLEETKTEFLVQRKLGVHGKKSKTTLTFLHLQTWPDHDIPNTTPVVKLIEEVLKSQQSLGNQKIMVICSDGANRSGTFIACMNTLEQLKVEQHVDIFQNVRRIRLIRPQFVENLEKGTSQDVDVKNQRQYQFIYNVTNDYLDSFSTYSNFT